MKISIITATWNSSKTVRDTFESVLRQHFIQYEYWVIDGGSTDGTVDIIKEYEPKFSGRMHWLSERDKGLYDAMNKGIERATGDVIGILNSDDFYTSDDILSVIAESFEEDKQLDAIYGDVHYVSQDDTSRVVRYYSSRVFRRGLMRLGFMPAHPSFYCKKDAYERHKVVSASIDGDVCSTEYAYFNPTYKIAADFDNLLKLIYVGRIRMRYLKRDFVTMRVGGMSSSGMASHKQINRDHLRALKENGIYSNIFLLSLRYVYKVWELFISRF